ncbi:hypothetical protein SUDANB120_06339 (plasmid) [Streptomyces sp. enrichment culture]
MPPHGTARVTGRGGRPVRPRALLLRFIRIVFALAVVSAVATYVYDLLP